MTIFQLIEMYINNKNMPKLIKYSMMNEGYEYFKWDEEDEEYRCEMDKDCYLSQVPWHHLTDNIKIIKE